MKYERNGNRKLESNVLNGTVAQYHNKNDVLMSYRLLKINSECQT